MELLDEQAHRGKRRYAASLKLGKLKNRFKLELALHSGLSYRTTALTIAFHALLLAILHLVGLHAAYADPWVGANALPGVEPMEANAASVRDTSEQVADERIAGLVSKTPQDYAAILVEDVDVSVSKKNAEDNKVDDAGITPAVIGSCSGAECVALDASHRQLAISLASLLASYAPRGPPQA